MELWCSQAWSEGCSSATSSCQRLLVTIILIPYNHALYEKTFVALWPKHTSCVVRWNTSRLFATIEAWHSSNMMLSWCNGIKSFRVWLVCSATICNQSLGGTWEGTSVNRLSQTAQPSKDQTLFQNIGLSNCGRNSVCTISMVLAGFWGGSSAFSAAAFFWAMVWLVKHLPWNSTFCKKFLTCFFPFKYSWETVSRYWSSHAARGWWPIPVEWGKLRMPDSLLPFWCLQLSLIVMTLIEGAVATGSRSFGRNIGIRGLELHGSSWKHDSPWRANHANWPTACWCARSPRSATRGPLSTVLSHVSFGHPQRRQGTPPTAGHMQDGPAAPYRGNPLNL